MVSQERRVTVLNSLSREEISAQNREAFDYLQGLLGDAERKYVGSEVSLSRSRFEGIHVVFVRKSALITDLQGLGSIKNEGYIIGSEGLLDVIVEGVAHLSSGLEHRFEISHHIGVDIDEGKFLPDGENSLKTSAKIIAEKVQELIEAGNALSE